MGFCINKEKKIINGALYLFISSIIVKVVGLLYKVPLSYILGDEGMSYFNSAYTVYTFFYIICTAGIPKSISIITSDYINRGEVETAESVVRIAFKVFLLFGTIVTMLFIIFSNPISRSIGNSGAKASMITVAPSIMFVCASGVLRGHYNGTFSFLPIAVSETVTALSRLIFGILFALIAREADFGISIVSAFTLIGGTLGSIISFIYLSTGRKSPIKRDRRGQNKCNKISTRSIILKIITVALPITLTGALGSICAILDLSLIMNLLKRSGYTELQANIMYGNFSTLVTPMLNLVASVIAPITTVLLPTVSAYKDKKEELGEKISIAFIFSLAVSTPAVFAFIALPREILSVIFEDTGAALAAPLLLMIAPALVFMSMLSVLNTALEAFGKTSIPLFSLILGTVFKLVITYFINRSGDFGLIGAPIGTVIFYLVGFLVSLSFILYIIKIKISISAALLKITISSALSTLITHYFKISVFRFSGISNLFLLLIFALLYVTFLFLFGFFNDKRLRIRSK